jgi:hypothetical protein
LISHLGLCSSPVILRLVGNGSHIENIGDGCLQQGSRHWLKALAYSSPRFALGQSWSKPRGFFEDATLNVASLFVDRKSLRNSFRVAKSFEAFLDPRFQSKLWVRIGQRFQRY